MTLLPEVLPEGKQRMSVRPNPGSPMAVERCVLMLWLVLCHVLVEQSVRTYPICTYYQRNSVQHIRTSIVLDII